VQRHFCLTAIHRLAELERGRGANMNQRKCWVHSNAGRCVAIVDDGDDDYGPVARWPPLGALWRWP